MKKLASTLIALWYAVITIAIYWFVLCGVMALMAKTVLFFMGVRV